MSSELENLGLLIKKNQWRHHRMLDVGMMRSGISLVQWNALREIDRNPAESGHRLAELTFNSDPAFSTLAARLVRRGFVDRHPGAGRANTYRLTGSGEKMLSKGREVMQKVLMESFGPLNRVERATLSRLLTKLLDRPLVKPYSSRLHSMGGKVAGKERQISLGSRQKTGKIVR
jgi:DNA-binding MarR family transcriptional regulator